MKKLSLFLVPSLALALAACQNDDGNAGSVQSDGLQAVRITVNIPELMQTRAADALAPASEALFGPTSNSAMGGLTNLAAPKDADHGLGKYDLRYSVAVYRADNINGTDTTWTLVVPASTDATYNTIKTKSSWSGGTEGVNGTNETFNVRLTADRDYKVVCWADFVDKDSKADKHYDTSCLSGASTKTITCKDAADKQLNDESRDAYYTQKNFYVAVWTYGEDGYAEDGNKIYSKGDTKSGTTYDQDVYDTSDASTHTKIHSAGDSNGTDYTATTPSNPYITESLVLRRPFAKVRVVTTDWQSISNGKAWPDTYKITYKKCKRFNDFNPVTAESTSEDLGDATIVYTGNKISLDGREYALDYDMHKKNRTLTVDYLMTDKTEETAIQMRFEAYNSAQMDENDATKDLIIAKNFTTNIPIKRNWLTTILGNLLTAGGTFTIKISEPFIDEYERTYTEPNP